ASRLLATFTSLDNAVGEPTQLFDKCQAKHDRHGPCLTNREWGRLLIRRGEINHRVQVDAAGGVSNEFAREDVDARVALKRSLREFGKLQVIATRKVLSNFADLVLHDMMVVAKPLFRTDRLRIVAADARKVTVSGVQSFRTVVKPR